ncbi:MAG: hypothetical protein IPH79_09110 [Sphingomonadales bacterium]|nr:hypothetical protein [Sphingomonadales bacterium]
MANVNDKEGRQVEALEKIAVTLAKIELQHQQLNKSLIIIAKMIENQR